MAGGPDYTSPLLSPVPWAFQNPTISPTSIPTLPGLSLSEDELHLVNLLQAKYVRDRGLMQLTDTYYRGEQVIRQLGISIPPELHFLRTLLGWSRIAVDPYVERLGADGFRLKGATDSDPDLHDLWDENGLDSEQSLAFMDALSMARAYWTVGTNPAGGAPLIRAESPMNMSVLWSVDGLTPRSALQSYWVDDRAHAALILPKLTLHIAQGDKGQWEIVQRDAHDFDFVPVTRMANNPRTYNRDGFSEITPELRSLVDQGCRTLLNLTVGGEIYAVPGRLLLGATEESFQNPDGSPKAGFEAYITKMGAVERDENGELPVPFQWQVYDPSVFTKVIEHLAAQVAGMLAATPQDLGLYTDGNPITAEAYAVSEGRRDRRAKRKQTTFGVALVEVMQNALRWDNGGVLPDKFRGMAVDWHPVSMETPAVTADAISKYVTAGVLPPKSDVVLKKAGFNAVERAQIAQDATEDEAQQILRELATNVEAKDIKTGAGLMKAAGTPAPTDTAVKPSGNADSAA